MSSIATSFPALLISCRMEDGGFLTDGEKWTDSCNRRYNNNIG